MNALPREPAAMGDRLLHAPATPLRPREFFPRASDGNRTSVLSLGSGTRTDSRAELERERLLSHHFNLTTRDRI